MAQKPKLDIAQTIKMQNREYGSRTTAAMYAKKAYQAGQRLQVAIAAENVHQVMYEAAMLIENTNIVYSMLADETTVIDASTKK